jgi:hypothetical protein
MARLRPSALQVLLFSLDSLACCVLASAKGLCVLEATAAFCLQATRRGC